MHRRQCGPARRAAVNRRKTTIRRETLMSGLHFQVLSLLSLLLKAPVVPPGTPVSNAFMRQFASLTKLITVLAGIASDTDMQIEFFTQLPKAN